MRFISSSAVLLGLLTVLSSQVLSSQASAQDGFAGERDPNMRPRAGLHLALGFGGEARTDPDPFGIDADLAPTIGFGLRFEMPIVRFFSIGALIEFLSFNVDSPLADERQQVLDLDLLLKGRYPIRVGTNELSPYLAVPFGGSVWFIDNADNYRGINTGLLGGVEFTLGSAPLSLFAEFGWRFHSVKDDDIRVRTSQAALNIGGMFVF